MSRIIFNFQSNERGGTENSIIMCEFYSVFIEKLF
jgi:hypothetical protein